jgi:NitT/TauT family transport system permease protein
MADPEPAEKQAESTKAPEPAAAPKASEPTPRSKGRLPAPPGESFFALRAPLPSGLATLIAIGGPVLLLLFWFIASYGGLVSTRFLPAPGEVGRSILDLWFNEGLAAAIWVSTKRILISFALAVAVALPLGVLMGAFEPVKRFFEPVVAPFRYMPISAFIPLLVVWFGIYEGQKIAFLWLGVFVYLLPVVVTAIRAVPEEYVQTAYTLGASRPRVILTVLVRAALPDIFDAFRVMNAISWTYIVLAEQVNMRDPPGLGYIVNVGMVHGRSEMAFAVLIVIGVIGIGTDMAINALNRALFPWREKT